MFKWTVKTEIYKKALLLAVPIMVQMGITNAVGLIDNLMVGSLGTESITAVSIAVQLIFVFNLGVFGAISGPGIYCAQYYGQKNKEGFWNVFRLKFWICCIVLAIALLVYNLFDTFFINLYLKGESSGIDKAVTLNLSLNYFKIMLWGLLPFTVTQIYASSLRETGESVKPMIAGISSVLIDVIFNYLLIFGKLGFPRLGVEGAAMATVLARVVEMLVIVIWSYISKVKIEYITGALREITIPVKEMMVVAKKSLPIFFNEFLWALSFVSTFQCYSLKGLNVIAAMNIAGTLQNLVIVVIISMGSAVGILIGQQLGASEFDSAKEKALRLTRFTGFLGFIVTCMVISISGIFPTFFETTDSIRTMGRNFIIINAICLPMHGILNSLYFVLRSGGKTFITFLFDSVFSWIFMVPTAFVLCKFTDLPILSIFVLVNGLEIIKIIIGYILIKKGVWISNLVETTKLSNE